MRVNGIVVGEDQVRGEEHAVGIFLDDGVGKVGQALRPCRCRSHAVVRRHSRGAGSTGHSGRAAPPSPGCSSGSMASPWKLSASISPTLTNRKFLKSAGNSLMRRQQRMHAGAEAVADQEHGGRCRWDRAAALPSGLTGGTAVANRASTLASERAHRCIVTADGQADGNHDAGDEHREPGTMGEFLEQGRRENAGADDESRRRIGPGAAWRAAGRARCATSAGTSRRG